MGSERGMAKQALINGTVKAMGCRQAPCKSRDKARLNVPTYQIIQQELVELIPRARAHFRLSTEALK